MARDPFAVADYAVAPGRSCGDCAMCCHLPAVAALAKPSDRWCVHCSTRRRCDVWPERPDECRDFFCHWMTDASLDERWRPSRARFMLVLSAAGDRLTVRVHPSRPRAWREAPYHAQLRRWAAEGLARGRQVIVDVAGRKTIVLPHEDRELGVVGPDQEIATTVEATPAGLRVEAHVRPKAGGGARDA